MRLVFFGTPQTAVPSLEALLDAGHEILSVVTRPDRPVGRSGRPAGPPIKRVAVERGLEVRQPGSLRRGTLEQELREGRPDLLVVVAYGRIFPPSLLELAPHGAVNLHFSLLPKYRGAAPVQWSLACGERTTGVTTMRMNEQLDEGDLLLRREIAIEEGEHAPALAARLAGIGAALLVETVRGLEAGSLESHPQDHARASLAPILTAEESELDPSLTAREVEGRIRGFDPWPGVWARRQGKRIRLVEARELPGETSAAPPGTVTELRRDGLLLACAGGSLLSLQRLQPEGRRPMRAADAVNGRQIAPGDRLG